MEAVGWIVGVVIGVALAGHAASIGLASWRRGEAQKIQDAAALGWTRVEHPRDER